LVTTRRALLLLLRTKPGSTVNELAASLSLSVVGVRRHVDALVAEGLVERAPARPGPMPGVGRPPCRWRLTTDGLEQFPRRYDRFALDLLEDLGEEAGPEVVEAVLARRTEKLAIQYAAALADVSEPADRVRVVAALRDQAGYLTDVQTGPNGDTLLIENNCAVHRVAERHSAVCATEMVLFRRVLGPDVEVTRVSHTMAGDPVCCYRVCARRPEDGTVG
jgi:predicted ArsR family transcriptional regulator